MVDGDGDRSNGSNGRDQQNMASYRDKSQQPWSSRLRSNTTDLSDNDIIEGYQIACSCGNIRLRRLVDRIGRSSGGFGRQYNCPDIIEYLNGLRSGNE
jgi:hypothetical protein